MAVEHEPGMCPRSPESQPFPGLHQKQCGQQGEGDDPAPLLCAGEASPGVLRPDVESSVQEDLMELIQRRATQVTQGMESLPCVDRLRELGCSAWRRKGSREI